MATGQYRKQNLLPSDAAVAVVLSGEALSTSTYVDKTADYDCRGFREVDFFIHIDTTNSMTKVHAAPQAGQALDSATVEYAPYLTETVDLGIATTKPYIVELDDPAVEDGKVYKVTVPVEGRYVRLALKATGGAGTVTVYAQRRV